MTKVSRRKLGDGQINDMLNCLWSAITLMNSKADVRLLFNSLFTRTEYQMFAKRLLVARSLLDGRLYNEIEDELKVTSATIAKISDILAERGEGLRKAHQKLSDMENDIERKRQKVTRNMENPFRSKARRKTLLGSALAETAKYLDKKIVERRKRRSAGELLSK